MYTRQFKLNHSLKGLPVDSIVDLLVDDEGVPLRRYWRKRYHDALTDNCMEEFPRVPEKKLPTKKSKKESDSVAE